jgi:hypothetical protein
MFVKGRFVGLGIGRNGSDFSGSVRQQWRRMVQSFWTDDLKRVSTLFYNLFLKLSVRMQSNFIISSKLTNAALAFGIHLLVKDIFEVRGFFQIRETDAYAGALKTK